MFIFSSHHLLDASTMSIEIGLGVTVTLRDLFKKRCRRPWLMRLIDPYTCKAPSRVASLTYKPDSDTIEKVSVTPLVKSHVLTIHRPHRTPERPLHYTFQMRSGTDRVPGHTNKTPFLGKQEDVLQCGAARDIKISVHHAFYPTLPFPSSLLSSGRVCLRLLSGSGFSFL